MADKISSLDDGYESGDLSHFPEAIDGRDNLYEATNNSVTILKQSLPYNGKLIIVEDTSSFPANGIVRIGPPPGEPGESEYIYYNKKSAGIFKDLVRGFAGSRQTSWKTGSYVSNSVFAEHHNAIKDALLNIEKYLGTDFNPDAGSLTDLIQQLETKFLSPKPLFRAFPLRGTPPLTVSFQNYSLGDGLRWFWDFGDGTSADKNPVHTFQAEGTYTVKLNLITETGGQGIAIKKNYIVVSEKEIEPFYYISQKNPETPAYSIATAEDESSEAAIFEFVDQTDGNISQRVWIFGDGEKHIEEDPDKHTATHQYADPGSYDPSLIIVFSDATFKRVFLSESLVVL